MQKIGGLKLSVFLYFLYTHFINLLRKWRVCEKTFAKYFVSEKIKPNYSAVSRQYDVNQRTVKAARFPIVKRLSDFNYQFQPSVNQQQIDEFAAMSFLDNQENIIFIGNPGVGKTHLSIGLGIEACRQGVRTLFINCQELILRLKAAQKSNIWNE